MQFEIRPLTPEEYPILEDFLYEAIFIPEGITPPPREIIRQPELQVYIREFGTSPHDRALGAIAEGRVIGAVWVRIMDDYGHVDAQTPSFAISLYPAFRGQGIGTALMQSMLAELKGAGYRQASLSVQKENYAARMYRKLGFRTIAETDEEYLMVYDLTGQPDAASGIY